MSGQDKMRRALEKRPILPKLRSLALAALKEGKEHRKGAVQIPDHLFSTEAGWGGGLLTMVPQPGALVGSLLRAPFLPQSETRVGVGEENRLTCASFKGHLIEGPEGGCLPQLLHKHYLLGTGLLICSDSSDSASLATVK